MMKSLWRSTYKVFETLYAVRMNLLKNPDLLRVDMYETVRSSLQYQVQVWKSIIQIYSKGEIAMSPYIVYHFYNNDQ
jgi:hypothetical protein